MRTFLERRVGRPGADWLWVVALLALPCCTSFGSAPPPASALTTAIFCDIPKLPPGGRHCASPGEQATVGRAASAAVALNTGQTMTIVLDESPAARAACGGQPQVVAFESRWPEGKSGCVDPTVPTDPNAFCVQQCTNLIADAAFCGGNAHVSTNVPVGGPNPGFAGACRSEGVLREDFDDPRKVPEPVVWRDQIGTSDSAGSLTRTSATSPPATNPPFNTGAVSTQWFRHGDGYVEFAANEINKSHVVGLSQITCPFPCADIDPSLTDIHFGISLNKDGHFYVIEGGSLVPGPDLNGSFGTYSAGERYRVSVKQGSDDSTTATITYSRLTSSCVPGNPCPETPIFTHVGLAHYPLRVDASFREQGATLSDVRVVHIQ